MRNLTCKEGARFFLDRDNFLIVSHRRPDGDTAGCAAALCRGLRAAGKTAHILENPQLTSNYAPYHRGLTCPALIPGATVVTVDVAGREMLCRGAESLEIDFFVDHHGSNPGLAPVGILEPEAAACGEIILDLIDALGVSLDREMAEALYVAVSTDTGCFRYANTTARTFRVAAACLEAGVDPYPINQSLFETVTMARLRLNAYMAQHLELLQDGRVALCLIPPEVERELGIREEDMENVASFARNVEGVCLAATFRTTENGDTKLSLRASPDYDVARVAVALGGGGHRAAAGVTLHKDQAQAREQLLAVLRQQGIV